MTSSNESQLANAVLMIRPVRFFSNPQTAASNRFQGKTSLTADEQQLAALAEFNGLAAALERAGIDVVVVDDTEEPPTPDAVFPNNWISTHADGTVVLYPMEAENRRTERRQDIIDGLAQQHGFHVRRVIDLSPHEERGHYLEGTGSLVLDRVNRRAYACLSSRTHLDALGDFAQQLDYDVVAFDAVDSNGATIYHTNVLMNVGEKLAVVCLQAIQNPEQRDAVQKSLLDSGHALVDLTYQQLESFAGNMLELRAKDGSRVLAMSAQADQSLTAPQRAAIEAVATIVSAPIDRIEASAGGSVRCMLAELHLPRG
ncbi:MAG: arginine deiminase-related protein [Woeseia sp.]